MPIGSAIQRGRYVDIYDEKGQRRHTFPIAGLGPHDGLISYTSSTISVRQGMSLYIYDENGRPKHSIAGAFPPSR